MKYEKIGKWLLLLRPSHQEGIKYYFFILFFILQFTGNAQRLNFKFDRTPVSKALVEIAEQLNVRIAFDAGQLEKFVVSKLPSGKDAIEIIASVLEGTNHNVEYRHGIYLITKSPINTPERLPIEKTVLGIVFDKESGERLPYANAVLCERNLSVFTSVDGLFSVNVSDSVSVRIQIKCLGYFPLDTIISTSVLTPILNFGLSKKIHNLRTVEVAGQKLKMVDFSRDAGHFTFNPSRFSDLPNYGETDVFRALQLIPGISSSENSSQLNIRGSSADQNLVLFDGFTLYNLDHFFGIFSALNPNIIKNIQVYRGGFDSKYGERVSGIVDITGKSGNQQKPEFYGGVNLISANLTAEIPISKKTTLVAAARRAYTDIYSSWLSDELLSNKISQSRNLPNQANVAIKPEFYFGDYNVKLTHSISQVENLSLSFYGSNDYLNSSSQSNDARVAVNTEDINKWGNFGFGATWRKQWNPNYYTTLQLGHSGYYNTYFNKTNFTSSGSQPPGGNQSPPDTTETNETNNLTDYFIAFRNELNLNPKNQFEFGLSVKYNEFKFYKDAKVDFIYNNLKNSSFLYTVFLQDKIVVGQNLDIKPGFRLNYYGNTNKIYFEPRLTANYKTKSGVILKMATGKYFQYLNKSATEQSYGYSRDFWVLSDKEQHPVVSSNHFIVGASYETKKLFFDIEAYYKTVRGLQEYLFFQNPTQQPGQTPGDNLSRFISGTGTAFGIDFLAKYESSGFTSWLAYSLSKATRNFDEINHGSNIPSAYDQTHEIKWTNIYANNRWNFSTLTLFTTGQPYIKSSEKDDDFNTTRTYDRLPTYFRIDFSVNYNFNFRKVNIKPGMSILNVMNTANYLDVYTRSFDYQNNIINETTLIKAQDLTLNFFVNFRF